MTVQAISSPADIVNLALGRIGFKSRIGSLYDGSMAAKHALDLFAPTRDEILRAGDWHFAKRTVLLTLLKSAPDGGYVPGTVVWDPTSNPPPPWIFEYAYPDDCLKIRIVKTVSGLPNFDPRPNIFTEANDNSYDRPRKVVLCNVKSAMAEYTGQVTDPLTWDADFVEALAAALARRLSPLLANIEMAKAEAQDEKITHQIASEEQG